MAIFSIYPSGGTSSSSSSSKVISFPVSSFPQQLTNFFLLVVESDGSEVSRNYTPVTSSLSSSVDTQCPSQPVDSTSSLFFLIKTYPQGPFTSRLHRLQEGSTIQVSDPVGTFQPDTQLEGKSQIVAIAAGTGITPMIRVILDALRNNKLVNLYFKLTSVLIIHLSILSFLLRRVSVVFFNRERGDIIWNDQFENLKSQHSEMYFYSPTPLRLNNTN